MAVGADFMRIIITVNVFDYYIKKKNIIKKNQFKFIFKDGFNPILALIQSLPFHIFFNKRKFNTVSI